MSLNRFHIVSPIALMAFSACRSPYVQGGSVGGAVVNGPLDSALVFLDYDFDGVLDANEPNARTNSFGEYQLTSTRDLYDLVAIADDQTVDSSSGATFAGITLKAPSGAGVISPTSTLMKEGDLTAAEVAEVLGLPDGVDPLSFNPFNVDENDATEVARALEVAKISKQITTAISSFASATEGAGADAADAFNTALNSVVEVVKAKAVNAKDANAAAADKIIDFTGTDDLDLIKTQVTTKAADLKGLDRATFNNLAADTTAAIRNVNTEIKAVTDLNSDATKNIFSTTQVLRDQIKDVAVARKAGQAGDITFKSADAVRTSMNNKAPEAITLSGSKFIHGDAESLVIGEVGTIDSDTGDTTFTYTLAGRDADMFSFNATTGELSLKAQPDHAKKPYYEITIISKDPGGKKFAETFIIDVVPEFGALGAPDPQILADFDMIMKENPIFMKMAGQIHLKTTPDGKLVMEEMASPGPGSGPATGPGPKPGEIVGIINITDRGYELRNPANEEYMGGFFKYETEGLTYTGFEVFIEDENELGRFEKHLKKYFAPNSEYGAKKLGYTERDVDFVSLVGAKVVDKAGKVVSDMLGFSHYDENMKILGSTGIDKADPNYPYYVEVKGEFVPGVNSNITATAVDAGTATIMKDLIMIASDAILYAEDPGTAVGGESTPPTPSGGTPTAGGAPTEIIEVQAGSLVKFKYEAAERGSVLQQAEFVFLDDNGGRIPVRDFDNDGIASFKTSSNLMNGVYTLNQVILSDFNDISNSANYFANEITAFGPPGSTPPQGTNLGLITKNEFSYSNHNFDLGKYAIKIVGGQEARTDFTPPELISVTIDNPAITPGQQVSVKYNANDDSPINNVYFRFVNDAGDQITLRDTDDDGVATFDVSALNMNGSYTLQEASFRDVAGNYSRYKAVGGHSGPPPPPGMPINNDPKLNLETSTGWPNKEFSSHNFDFSQFTLEMSGGIAVQTDFTHPELAALETVATVNQGAAGTINYTPSEDLEIASFVFKNDAGKSLHFEDRENDGIARVSKNQTDTAGTYKLSQIWMRDLNKVQNSARYDEGNELELFSRQIFTETTHEVDFSNIP